MRSAEQDDFAPNPWKARALAAEAARDAAEAATAVFDHRLATVEAQRDRLAAALRKIVRAAELAATVLNAKREMEQIARGALSVLDTESNPSADRRHSSM